MTVRAPKGLGRPGRALLRAVNLFLDEELLDLVAHEIAVLHEACRVADRLEQLRAALDGADLADPATVRLLAEERQQRLALANLLVTKLGLPTGLADAGSTPQSRRAAKAANTRWTQHRPPGLAVSDAASKAAQARWRTSDGA